MPKYIVCEDHFWDRYTNCPVDYSQKKYVHYVEAEYPLEAAHKTAHLLYYTGGFKYDFDLWVKNEETKRAMLFKI